MHGLQNEDGDGRKVLTLFLSSREEHKTASFDSMKEGTSILCCQCWTISSSLTESWENRVPQKSTELVFLAMFIYFLWFCFVCYHLGDLSERIKNSLLAWVPSARTTGWDPAAPKLESLVTLWSWEPLSEPGKAWAGLGKYSLTELSPRLCIFVYFIHKVTYFVQ